MKYLSHTWGFGGSAARDREPSALAVLSPGCGPAPAPSTVGIAPCSAWHPWGIAPVLPCRKRFGKAKIL